MRLSRQAGFPQAGERALAWLGQAGFWIDTGKHGVLIDPYLSDSLAKKYAGKLYDHQRMMPPPVTPDALPRPDIVLITHAHTDHMDPETLRPLAERFSGLPFVVPRARLDVARERIGEEVTLIGTSDGETLELLPGLSLRVLPAAHEALERDADGHAVFLGFAITSGGLTIYHSGDCVPFDGLADLVRDLSADIALLPVNGRDARRREAAIPGNFSLDEAIALCRDTDIPWMIPHHFGMFAFNTERDDVIDAAVAVATEPQLIKPRADERICIER